MCKELHFTFMGIDDNPSIGYIEQLHLDGRIFQINALLIEYEDPEVFYAKKDIYHEEDCTCNGCNSKMTDME